MKQSNSVARPGLHEPLAFPNRVGSVAAHELQLSTPQAAACLKASQGNGIGRCSLRRCDWAPQMGTFSSLEFAAFAVALDNLPPT